jgi:simple sugar transport system ATP-binding protein
MHFNVNRVILDKPTTALSLKETRKVLNFVQKIKDRGSSCIFITHNLYHAYEVSERFVIMDRGSIVSSEQKSKISYDELYQKMMHIANEIRR